MKFADEFTGGLSHGGGWLTRPGPDGDIVMSSRARLARNLRGHRFLLRADPTERAQIEGEVRAALEKADFPSVRGNITFGNNHFPIQNFYSREVVADADGKWTTKITGVALENHQDVYAKDCKL